jgi:hypothetical protein
MARPKKNKASHEVETGAGAAAPRPGSTETIEVEGKVVTDPSEPLYPVRTPRDVAINKAKRGEGDGLETSKPDHSEKVHITRRHATAGRFTDADGNTWERTSQREDRKSVLSRSAILKDGGDPGILGIEDEDKYEVDGPVGNEQLSPNGIMDSETGEIREKTEEELAAGTGPRDEVRKAKTMKVAAEKPRKVTKARRVGNGKGASR